MLIEFAISNFRSIKDRQVFSMLPSDRVKDRTVKLLTSQNYPNLSVLPAAVIYGKNNAGKSNFIRAFRALEWLVLNSHKITVGDSLDANEHFLLNSETLEMPTLFELDFIASNGVRYLLIIEFNREKIIREELFMFSQSATGKTTKRKWYIRNAGQSIQFGDELKGAKKPIEDRLLENVLFLSKAVNENNAQLRPIFEFFQQGIYVTDMQEGYIDFQTRYFGKLSTEKDGSTKMETLNIALDGIDSGILYLEVAKNSTLPKNFEVGGKDDGELSENERIQRDKILDTLKHEIKAIHRFFDGNEEKGVFALPLNEESEGTRKFIALFTKLMELQESGSLFIVDELERSLHPLLVQFLLQLITNRQNNRNNVQLIFTTHDTTIFDVLDQDQINILEKDVYGATSVYTISDIKGIRGDIPTQKWYLSGKLGGTPNINSYQINKALSTLNEQENK